MPDPVSRRGDVVTDSKFTGSWETPIYPLGVGGLDLTHAVDAVPVGSFTRLTNLTWIPGEPRLLTGRAGQTVLASPGGTDVHSIQRIDDPEASTFTRLWGVDGTLFFGPTAGSNIASGFSGDPLTIVPDRPPLSGDPWAYIADSAKMVKVRASDGLVVPIGLPAPTVAPTVAAINLADKAIFESLLTPPGFAWIPNAGTFDPNSANSDITPTPVPPVPVLNKFTFPKLDTGSIPNLAAVSGGGAYVYWNAPVTMNLSVCVNGAQDLSGQITPAIDPPPAVGSPVPITDEAIMHLLLGLSLPLNIDEVRLYVVVSSTFSTAILPGTANAAGANLDFYMKSFRAGDFSPMLAGNVTQATQSEVARINLLRQAALRTAGATGGFGKQLNLDLTQQLARDNQQLAAYDPALAESLAVGSGAGQAVEFGVVGNPLHRGDWQRFGNTAGRDWATVTGLVLYAHISYTPVDQPNLKLDPSPYTVTMDNWELKGQGGSDSSDAADAPYDWRYTFYDPRTGAESNPSPVMAVADFKDSLTNVFSCVPGEAAPVAGAVERWYRRGGTLVTDWFFMGETKADGTAFIDLLSDAELAASATVQINHFQPVPTVDDAGNTVLGQPVPILLGPVQGMLLALGDPFRPGYVYASLPGEPDHWPADLITEVCSPSEQLMNGAILGSQPYVFSRERGYAIYPNLSGQAGLTSLPTACMQGLAGRWAIAEGYGRIFLVYRDGVYSTNGDAAQLISPGLTPLFRGQTVNGYAPIDLTAESALRLTPFNQELWFGYQDVNGARHVWVFQLATQTWRHYDFAHPVAAMSAETGGGPATLLLGGATSGVGYTHSGTSDAGSPITWNWRTASWDWGRPREEKLFGDQILDADLGGNTLTWTNYVNSETVVNPGQALGPSSGRQRFIFDGFGTGPQLGRNLAIDCTGSGTGAPPQFFFAGTALTAQPDLTVNRVTNWDDLGTPDPIYFYGVTFDCDTGGANRTILIEYDLNGIVNLAATLTVNTNGRHKVSFTWPGVQAHQVRVRPNDDCVAWLLYRADWLFDPAPPIIAGWDIWFENKWDVYYTGLDLYCDTFGQPKQIQVSVDGVVLTDPLAGTPYWTVTTAGRRVVHLTLPWGRGHILHFVALDQNPGQLYEHQWLTEPEPREEWNFNQNFTVAGALADKYLKGVLLEVDTFGVDKALVIDVDGAFAAVTLPTTNTNGRRVVQYAFPQVLGRVFRLFSNDGVPGRLYSLQWIFDEEPLALTRWETQEIDHDLQQFYTLVEAMVTLKSTEDVTLTLLSYINQTGTIVTDTYTLPSTGNVKLKRFLPFGPTAVGSRKCCLTKYIFTSSAPFWLYREESSVTIQPWKGGAPVVKKPFGNDDLDETRTMTNAQGAAGRSGGGTA